MDINKEHDNKFSNLSQLAYIQLKVSISFGKETIGIQNEWNRIRMLKLIEGTEKPVRSWPSGPVRELKYSSKYS